MKLCYELKINEKKKIISPNNQMVFEWKKFCQFKFKSVMSFIGYLLPNKMFEKNKKKLTNSTNIDLIRIL